MSGWSGMAVVIALCAAMPRGELGDQPQQAREVAVRAPAAAPGCPAGLLQQMEHAVGTPVYLSLHREIAELRLGHEGSERLQAALAAGAGAGAGAPAPRGVAQVMTGMDKARDAYLCGGWLTDEHAADTAVDAVVRDVAGPVFQRMAEEVARLENSLVTKAAGRPAESSLSILEERRKTDEELMNAVIKSEAAAVDGDMLRVTCAERSRLIGEIAVWSSAGRDEFSVAAGLMQDFLRAHSRCAVR